MTWHNGTCTVCQRPITFAHTSSGVLLRLERHEQSFGSNRYAIWDDGIAFKVRDGFEGLAHEVHVCPETR